MHGTINLEKVNNEKNKESSEIPWGRYEESIEDTINITELIIESDFVIELRETVRKKFRLIGELNGRLNESYRITHQIANINGLKIKAESLNKNYEKRIILGQKLIVEIPHKIYEKITIKTNYNAHVIIITEVSSKIFSADTLDGGINVCVNSQNVNLHSYSGHIMSMIRSIHYDEACDKLVVKSVNGAININAHAKDIKLYSENESVQLNVNGKANTKVDIATTDGYVKVDYFHLKRKRVNITTKGEIWDRNREFLYGDTYKLYLNISSINGKVYLND